MNDDCQGIIGFIKGHNFKPIYTTEQIPATDLAEVIEAIDKLQIYQHSRQELIKKQLEESKSETPVILYCTRCGLQEELNPFL